MLPHQMKVNWQRFNSSWLSTLHKPLSSLNPMTPNLESTGFQYKSWKDRRLGFKLSSGATSNVRESTVISAYPNLPTNYRLVAFDSQQTSITGLRSNSQSLDFLPWPSNRLPGGLSNINSTVVHRSNWSFSIDFMRPSISHWPRCVRCYDRRNLRCNVKCFDFQNRQPHGEKQSLDGW